MDGSAWVRGYSTFVIASAHMAQVVIIALFVVLVASRLLMPPAPGLLRMGLRRWGTRKTISFCAMAAAFGLVAVLLSR